jgi:hypothetical protein
MCLELVKGHKEYDSQITVGTKIKKLFCCYVAVFVTSIEFSHSSKDADKAIMTSYC